jgi:putative hydrolase of the HAD superfamily
MIGDNLQTDIMGAMAAGIDALFFNRFPEHEKTTAPTFVVTSLREIIKIL